MPHQITITLTEQQYTTLQAMAAARGQQPETLLHDMLVQHLQTLPASTNHPITEQEFMEQQYRENKTLNTPHDDS